MNTVRYRRIAIPPSIHEELQHQMAAELPNECCGMLAGAIEGETARVTHRYPLMNVLRSPTRFRASADELLAVQRKMRADGVELLAIYHSHPTSDPVPSRIDLAEHYYGEHVACVIVGSEGIRAWRWGEEMFDEIELTN